MKIFRARKDLNHKSMIAAYRLDGCSVMDISAPDANDVEKVDLVIGIGGINDLVEIKSKNGRLTDGQKKAIREWNGGKIWVIKTEAERRAHVQNMMKRSVKQ